MLKRLFLLGTVADPDPKNTERNFSTSFATRFFLDYYGPILMNPIVKALAIVWLAIYLAFGIWGFIRVHEGLKPSNLLVRDSYAILHYENLEENFWVYGSQVQIVVNNATDLSTEAGRQEAVRLVEAFANASYCKSGSFFFFGAIKNSQEFFLTVGCFQEIFCVKNKNSPIYSIRPELAVLNFG